MQAPSRPSTRDLLLGLTAAVIIAGILAVDLQLPHGFFVYAAYPLAIALVTAIRHHRVILVYFITVTACLIGIWIGFLFSEELLPGQIALINRLMQSVTVLATALLLLQRLPANGYADTAVDLFNDNLVVQRAVHLATVLRATSWGAYLAVSAVLGAGATVVLEVAPQEAPGGAWGAVVEAMRYLTSAPLPLIVGAGLIVGISFGVRTLYLVFSMIHHLYLVLRRRESGRFFRDMLGFGLWVVVNCFGYFAGAMVITIFGRMFGLQFTTVGDFIVFMVWVLIAGLEIRELFHYVFVSDEKARAFLRKVRGVLAAVKVLRTGAVEDVLDPPKGTQAEGSQAGDEKP